MIRDQRAHDLLDSVKQLGPHNVTNADIAAMTGLLDNLGDPARYWVAVTLGDIGPRATQAVPALERAYEQEVCITASKAFAPAIRSALINIGVTPPEAECPIVENGYAQKASITIFDARGQARIFDEVPPGHCINVRRDGFVLTKIVVVPDKLPPQTYASDEFRAALEHTGVPNGFLVVDENGLRYVPGYQCD